ncbi:hypothetical protein L6164_000615 [Bauhinia variegata]|uniref:Uncharacterized protein n=1 Tax=Bauhinia variegata TaxID=167791 RepID=A0ACB9Q8G5_BAUVA|nr:hypothetical protein L6164_000615 [Bauhinia variegata]
MSLPASTNVSLTHNVVSADYHPSIWGDYFLQYASQSMEVDQDLAKQINLLKEEGRKKLIPASEQPIEKLKLIDSIQRLGVFYHFEREIDEVLQHVHKNFVHDGIITLNEDLHSLALIFRLLRQQGYRISSDVFNKFKDAQGKFSRRLTEDIEGILSLYEATHLRVHGEDTLEEALAFTSAHLESMASQLSPSLAAKVKHSLMWPLRKSLSRLEAWHYISAYQEDPSHDEILLTLAKIDFNALQKMHQIELGILTKWWKDLDFATKLPFARDRMVECYFWILGVYFEPYYSLGRRITTKVITLTSVLDDLYDVYGTLEELQLFTNAIDSWDISRMDFLPEYMRVCFQAVLDVYEEIGQEMTKEGRAFCVDYAKDKMKRQVQAYFAEAKWYNTNYTPILEEYLDIALTSSGYPLVTTISFVGMGPIATEEVFQWLSSSPKIVRASSIVARLMDDVVSNDLEQKRGHVSSAVECYIKEHGVKRQDAIDELNKQVANAWKDVNEEFLDPTQVPKPLLMAVLNLTRVMEVLYRDGDCYTHSQAEPEAVFDTSGQELRSDFRYHILSLDEADTALTISQFGNDSCPWYVVKETHPNFKGQPATFLPIDPDSADRVIRTSTNYNIRFPRILSPCNNSMVWRLIKRISEALLVGLDGVEGNPGFSTAFSWFKIEKADDGYSLVFCPTDICHCSVVCSELGIFVGDDNRSHLGLSNPGQIQKFRVKFERAEEEEKPLMSILNA